MAASPRHGPWSIGKEMADETNNVRIWGGIHFRTSLEVGYDMGRKIADFLVENSLRPAG